MGGGGGTYPMGEGACPILASLHFFDCNHLCNSPSFIEQTVNFLTMVTKQLNL